MSIRFGLDLQQNLTTKGFDKKRKKQLLEDWGKIKLKTEDLARRIFVGTTDFCKMDYPTPMRNRQHCLATKRHHNPFNIAVEEWKHKALS